MMNRNYQPEIDGIRAIAVMSVVLFHVEYALFAGGFVGVDVFFVISGFLITRLIVKDVRANTFSFKQFYLRRIRRLAPALIATLVVTFCVSFFYLTPAHFERFSAALIASILSVSNILFWTESGYFDAEGVLKPLLHTWSLSVEEQFYLVWPAFLVLLAARARWVLVVAILGLSLLSLVGARMLTSYSPSTSFFMMPFRIYEFGMGAVLALVPAMKLRNWIRELLLIAGLLLVGYSVFVFGHSTPLPDVYALIPCLGTVLLLISGSAKYGGWVLRNSLSVWLGKISYSLYLVHWPVVVLYRHITFADMLVGRTRLVLLLLMLVLAVLMYVFIENRFRHVPVQQSVSIRRPAMAWLTLPLVLSMAAAHATIFDGWGARFDTSVMRAVGDIEAKQLIRRRYIEGPEALSDKSYGVAPEGEDMVKLLVVGDSHATDMFNAMYLNLAQNPKISVRRQEIDDECLYLFVDRPEEESVDLSAAKKMRCETQLNNMQQSALVSAADRILVSSRWERSSFAYLERFVNYLLANTGAESRDEIVITGRTAEFKNVPSLILSKGLTEKTAEQLGEVRVMELDEINLELSELSKRLKLPYLDKLEFLCDPASNQCDAVDANGAVLYTDYGHWSLEGAKVFGQRMLDDKTAYEQLTGLPKEG